jgi:DNA repair exonuclease SbcCD nuclease subunit
MKFIHAADLHLDSPLAGIARRGSVPEHVLNNCTRRALAAMVELALAEDVGFVVIAGDVYDADWKDYSTGLFFAEQMRRLGRPCFLVRGNHDAASVITSQLQPPPNVHEFSSRSTETVRRDDLGVAVHGRSFPHRAVPEDLSAAYPPPLAGLLNIGLLHTSADDPGEHATYAPCSVPALAMKGYDYWALGHIHARRELARAPWIVFPGNLQGRHAKETGAKGCTLVEVEDRRIVSVEHRPVDVLRWAAVAADVGGVQSLAGLAERVRPTLAAAAEQADGRPLLVRLTLAGATPLHPALLAEPLAVEAECQNAAIAAADQVWLESVRLCTRLPQADAAPAPSADALALLAEAFRQALDDPALGTGLLAEMQGLVNRLPGAVGTDLDVPCTAEQLRALAPDAWQIVAHALTAEGAP